jgi:N6-adenosine-specific RNA methylase IME4
VAAGIVRYEALCRALAQARLIDEVKDIANKAIALKLYARQAKNKDLEVDAAEIRLRAERRLGEMLIEHKQTIGLDPGTRGQLAGPGVIGGSAGEPPIERPNLANLGVSKKLSSHCQKLAAVPRERFLADLGAWRERVARENERVTLDVLVRQPDKAERRAEREAELGARQRALPDKKYGVIYADYPRRFNVHSRETGLDRSPENHYPTMTFRQIVDLPVRELAAPDCVLFYWSTAASLVDDFEIMAEWGFLALRPRDELGRLKRDAEGEPLPPIGAGTYRSHQIWLQDKLGLGYWFRDVHESLLVGARGKIVAPAPGSQDRSVVAAKLGPHSRKPEHFAEMIERLFPSLPKIELFARRGRPGWDVWGYEAPDDGATESPAVAETADSYAPPGARQLDSDGATAAAAGDPGRLVDAGGIATEIDIPNFLGVRNPCNKEPNQ